MTGAVKWGRLDSSVHIRHLRDLEALAESGRAWAHAALESNAALIYVTGAEFAPDVAAITQASRPSRTDLDAGRPLRPSSGSTSKSSGLTPLAGSDLRALGTVTRQITRHRTAPCERR